MSSWPRWVDPRGSTRLEMTEDTTTDTAWRMERESSGPDTESGVRAVTDTF